MEAETAREGIREIVADAETAYTGLWPQHPLDDPNDAKWMTMYCGAAGVAWFLQDCLASGGELPLS